MLSSSESSETEVPRSFPSSEKNDELKEKDKTDLENLVKQVRNWLSNGELKRCEEIIPKAMSRFPDAAQPHNLYGLLLEKEGKHAKAMKHFRAARALDPSYLPARQNLEYYGTFNAGLCCAFDESDCELPEYIQ